MVSGTLTVCYRLLEWQQYLFFGVAAHYDPLFFNDCRRELPEESLPVAGGALPVAEKGLPIVAVVPRSTRIRRLCHLHGCWCRCPDIDGHRGRGYWTPVTDLSHLRLFRAAPTVFLG